MCAYKKERYEHENDIIEYRRIRKCYDQFVKRHFISKEKIDITIYQLEDVLKTLECIGDEYDLSKEIIKKQIEILKYIKGE